MNFNIIVLKTTDDNHRILSLTEIQETRELGTDNDVQDILSSSFKGYSNGLWKSQNDYLVEFSLPKGRATSLHITIHFSGSSVMSLKEEFLPLLKMMCYPNGWLAFAVSDNSRLT